MRRRDLLVAFSAGSAFLLTAVNGNTEEKSNTFITGQEFARKIKDLSSGAGTNDWQRLMDGADLRPTFEDVKYWSDNKTRLK
jgi:hypothetical protein